MIQRTVRVARLAVASLVLVGVVVTWDEPVGDVQSAPVLPNQLFRVPLNLPDISDDPLHEPAAVVYQATVRTGVFDENERPIIIGAETGRARAIREAGDWSRAIPSPDGTKLGLVRFGIEYTPAELVILDLVNDETLRYALPDDGLGGAAEHVIWSPDGTRLAVEASVVEYIDDRGSDGSSAARLIAGEIDLETGAWEPREDWTRAFSPDGERVITDDFRSRYVVETAAGAPVVLTLDTSPDDGSLPHSNGLVFSPDGTEVASLTNVQHDTDTGEAYAFSLETFAASTGEHAESVELGTYVDAQVLGWGEEGVVIQTTTEIPRRRAPSPPCSR